MIDMQKIKQVATLADEYNACWSAANAANDAAKEMITAVRGRITAEKERDTARLDELQARCEDLETSETVKQVAKMEMQQIKARKYGITETERTTLQAELDKVQAAIEDGTQLTKKLRESVWNATEEINSIKAETYGNAGKDFTLAARWLEGTTKEAARL